ncbi:CHAT domain-containing protein [Tautonia plasticadhaerens]|uniref:CHAT domain protein n=1 Tax=Tautonia plasticadhaerens TaxID=2527974 RepID=A0A518HBB4_9BACT|nr:CHAT domain-containing protein [Tautonia plasticadhaerens]QDV38140.1 CHAT domain protein [Tautonia plasticadhaerens]
MTQDRPGQDGRTHPAARMPPPAPTAMLALLLASLGIGCAPGGASSRDQAEASVADDARSLAPPGGKAAGVEGLCWGGPAADRRLGVRFDDGRFAAYRPPAGPGPVSVGLVPPGRGDLSSLALCSADRAVTGDGRGLLLWDTSGAIARPIDRLDCGAIGALAVEPIGPGDLLAGLGDGRLLRFRPGRDAIGPPRAEARSSGRASGVTGLGFADGGRSVLVFRADGGSERRGRSLDGPAEPIGPARSAAEGAGGGLVRLVGPADDGPALVRSDRDGVPRWRFPLPAEGVELAGVLRGEGLVVACEGRILLVRGEGGGPPRPSEVRGLPAEGEGRVASDPLDPAGRRLAVADSAGRLLVYDAEDLARSAGPISLDGAPDLAFRPHRRAYHPRPGEGRASTTSERLAGRIAEARRRLDRGELDGLLATVRDLEADPALDRDASAEVAALTAAVRQATGWPTSSIRPPIDSARSTFEQRGWSAREADLRLWAGSLLLPGFDGRGAPADPVRIEEALAELREAAALYRSADPGLERQARIAEAMASWGLLTLGRPAEAHSVFGPVARFAEADPVIRQAPEFDRIAAALAASRGDWEAADLASDRLLRRLTPPPAGREDLAREAALERVGDLAALGRWAEAARVLAEDRPSDPEWALRRATVRRRAGIDVGPVPDGPPGGPSDLPEAAAIAHVRGRVAVASEGSLASGAGLLALAGEAHREAGRSDLAIEADLERAEALERLGRPGEAIALYARVARTLAPEGDRPRTRGAARPIAFAAGRAHRGLARCQLAGGMPGHALGAIDQEALVGWFERSGEALVRSSRGIAPPGGTTEGALREARRSAFAPIGLGGADSGSRARVRGLEARRAAEHQELSLADPTRPFDPSSLRLGAGEAVLVVSPTGPESLSGFLIRPGGPVLARRLPIGRPALGRAARLWRASLGDGGRSCELDETPGPGGLLSIAPEPDLPPGETPPDGLPPGRLIVESVLGPFRGGLAGVDRLVVVPGDADSAVPLGALAAGEGGPGLPSIAYAPSLSMIRRARASGRGRGDRRGSVLVMSAGDVVGALAVRSAYGEGGPAVEVPGDLASLPARLIGPGGPRGVLQLSTVAVLDPAESGSGGPELLLGPEGSGGIDPGTPRLSESDVLGLELDGALVVLQLEHRPMPPVATPTAWRDLASGWLAAGADAVIVSLWDPPADSAPAFAAGLHRGLARGLSAAGALELARRSVAERPSTSDPVHWAGYVLYEPGGSGR